MAVETPEDRRTNAKVPAFPDALHRRRATRHRTRYSKLSLLGDYQRRYIKKAAYNNKGSQIGAARYSYLYSPTATQYIKVTYKS